MSIIYYYIKHFEKVYRLNKYGPIVDLEDITPTILDL